MTTMGADLFSSPAVLPDLDAPTYDRNGVRRSKDGRPYVKIPCPEPECVLGRVPGKRPGTTKACPKRCTEGVKEVLYTRCTTYVGALEDRQNLEAWQKRIVLLGLKASGLLADRLQVIDIDDREALDALAAEAYEAGDGHRAAEKGTDLHGLTELIDSGQPLPERASLADRADMAAWVRITEEYGLRMLDIERFVVVDRLKIGGTYDRRADSDDPRMACPHCDRPKVVDLKTGRIDYGAGKMAQQLAVYSRGRAYDGFTGRRSPHRVCQHYGYVIHLPQGTGTASMHRLDLTLGWQAVRLSKAVREHRRESKGWMEPLSSGLVLDFTKNP